MEEFVRRLEETETAESRTTGLAFQPSKQDVFIATYPKCGTTWVSFMLHLLRSDCDTDFDEITEVKCFSKQIEFYNIF